MKPLLCAWHQSGHRGGKREHKGVEYGQELGATRYEHCVMRAQGGESKLSLWEIRNVDISLGLKGLGDLCQLKKGEGIPSKGNSMGNTSKWEIASWSLVWLRDQLQGQGGEVWAMIYKRDEAGKEG